MDDQKLEDNRFLKLQRLHHLAIIKIVCIITYWFALSRLKFQEKVNRGVDSEADKIWSNLLKRFLNDKESRNIIRMRPTAFVSFCDLLVKEGGLRPTLQACVEEQVEKSLYLLGHNVTNRELRFLFCRSGETVSRHFHNFLGAIIELEEQFLKQLGESDEVPDVAASDSPNYSQSGRNVSHIEIDDTDEVSSRNKRIKKSKADDRATLVKMGLDNVAEAITSSTKTLVNVTVRKLLIQESEVLNMFINLGIDEESQDKMYLYLIEKTREVECSSCISGRTSQKLTASNDATSQCSN